MKKSQDNWNNIASVVLKTGNSKALSNLCARVKDYDEREQ